MPQNDITTTTTMAITTWNHWKTRNAKKNLFVHDLTSKCQKKQRRRRRNEIKQRGEDNKHYQQQQQQQQQRLNKTRKEKFKKSLLCCHGHGRNVGNINSIDWGNVGRLCCAARCTMGWRGRFLGKLIKWTKYCNIGFSNPIWEFRS